MSDRASLVRLVYADFLDETGVPADAVRAEFIRAQCEYAQAVPPRGGPQRADVPTWETWGSGLKDAFTTLFADDVAVERQRSPELLRREKLLDRVKELFDSNGNGWVRDAATAIGLPAPASDKVNFWRVVGVLTKVSKRVGWPYSWANTGVAVGDEKGLPNGFIALVFAGGFADELWVDPTAGAVRPVVEKWLAVGPARRLVLQEPDGSAGEFALTADHLRGVRTLALALHSDANVHRALLAAHAAGVSSLESPVWSVPADPFAAFDPLVRQGHANILAASDLLRTLRRLHLRVANYGDVTQLTAVETPELRELVLDFDFIDETATTDDDYRRTNAEYMQTFADGVLGGSLDTLTIQYAPANADFVRAVAGSRAWRGVTKLTLDFPIGPDAVAAFAEAAAFDRLTDLTLCLQRKTMTDGVCKAPPDEDVPTVESRRKRRRDDDPRKPRPVAEPAGPLPVARLVATGADEAAEELSVDEIPVATVVAERDPNGWAAAVRALAAWPGLRLLTRLRLAVCPLHFNRTDMEAFNVDGQPRFVGLPARAVGHLAAALAGGPLERLEIAGPTLDDRGRFEVQKHLLSRVAFV